MTEPFLSEIRIMSFNFAPRGWTLCNGQLLPINQNQALFSLLGTTYGGDGRVNFALPDLRSRVPIHMGVGNGVEFTLGERGGEEYHTLNQSEMPQHIHFVQASSLPATTSNPTVNYWANSGKAVYSGASPNAAMAPQAIGNTGGIQAHTNMSPFLVLNFCIALQGIFPSQN